MVPLGQPPSNSFKSLQQDESALNFCGILKLTRKGRSFTPILRRFWPFGRSISLPPEQRRSEDRRDLRGRPGGPAKEADPRPADPPAESPWQGVGRVGHELEQTVQPGDHGQFNDEPGTRVT